MVDYFFLYPSQDQGVIQMRMTEITIQATIQGVEIGAAAEPLTTCLIKTTMPVMTTTTVKIKGILLLLAEIAEPGLPKGWEEKKIGLVVCAVLCSNGVDW